MIESIKNNKVKVSVVSGVFIIATAYGTCTIDPNEEAIQQAVEEKVEPKEEVPAEEPKVEESSEEQVKEPVGEPKEKVPTEVLAN